MKNSVVVGSDLFEMEQEVIDVTSSHRPDTSWRFVDAAGHEHRWFADDQPAESYRSGAKYDVPTLVWVKDGVRYDEDGEPYDVGHNECLQCGEHVDPRYTADTTRRKMAGLASYWINGTEVPQEDFERRFEAARKHQGGPSR